MDTRNRLEKKEEEEDPSLSLSLFLSLSLSFCSSRSSKRKSPSSPFLADTMTRSLESKKKKNKKKKKQTRGRRLFKQKFFPWGGEAEHCRRFNSRLNLRFPGEISRWSPPWLDTSVKRLFLLLFLTARSAFAQIQQRNNVYVTGK